MKRKHVLNSNFVLGSKAIDGEIKPRELSVIDPVGMYQLFFIILFWLVEPFQVR